jgi:hypothetical protein
VSKILVTRTRVVLDRSQFATLLMHNAKAKKLIERMRDRVAEEHQLLQVALHELAIALGKKDPQHFTRRWLAQHREIPDPIPMRRQGRPPS